MDALTDEIDLLKDKVGENRKIIQLMSEQIAKRDEIIAAQGDYIKFCDKIIGNYEMSHIKLIKLCEKINKLKSEL
jgi:hypothetical protein